MWWKHIPQAISETAKWFNKKSARKKQQSIHAADMYILIDQTGMYKGKKISEEKEQDLKLHFSKQFNSWKFG